MAISIQVMNGTKGAKTLRLRGYLEGKEVFMLALLVGAWHQLLLLGSY